MKDLIDRIYENFYQNVSNISLSEEYDHMKYKRYDFITHKASTEEFTVIKDSGWYIDTLCDALLRNCSYNPVDGEDRNSMIRVSTNEIYPESSAIKYKKYTFHPDWYELKDDIIILPDCIDVDFKKLYKDTSVNHIIAKISLVKDSYIRSNTICAAYVMATLKKLNLLNEDAKFDDLKDDSLFWVGETVKYKTKRLGFEKDAFVRPPIGLDSNFDSVVVDTYNNTIEEIKELQNDLEVLRDNKYPINPMTEKTIRDISSRCRVIKKIASRFKK